MSTRDTPDTAQRLQEIREGINVLLAVNGDDSEHFETILTAYSMLEDLDTLAPEEIDTQILDALEELVQGLNASNTSILADYITLHKEGATYFRKFERWGDLDDLNKAIASWQRVVDMTPDSHSTLPSHLYNVGLALRARFEKVGSLVDLETALLRFQKAVDLTPDGHPEKPGCLSNLGNALERRFDRHGSLEDLEEAILAMRKAVNLTADGHPDIPGRLSNLGSALKTRFDRYGSLQDLEEALLVKRKAVDLTMDGHASKPGLLSNLGVILQMRFDRHGSLEDLENAVSVKRKAVDLTPDGHPNKPNFLSNVGSALKTRFDRHGSLQDLEAAILAEREAVDLTPDGHPSKPRFLNNLGITLEKRFDQRGSLEDLEAGILANHKAVDLTPDDHPNKPSFLNNLGIALETRFDRHGSLQDLEDAISAKRKAVNLTLDGDPSKSHRLGNLGEALQRRFDRLGSLEDLEAAILAKRKAVDLTPDGHPDEPGHLNNLGNSLKARFDRHGSLKDMEEAILAMRKAVDLTPDDHPDKSRRLNNLGNISEAKFYRHGAHTDLDDAIIQRQKAIHLMPDSYPDRALCLNNLGQVLKVRFQRLADWNDLQNALIYAQESARSPAVSSKRRLAGALLWAQCCTLASIFSFPAFECAIKVLPRVAWSGLAVDDQYFLLAEAGSVVRIAVEAAIGEGEDETAVEWAEQGRSIVWQNLLGLRTPLDRLQSQYPELATRLQELSQHLEQSAGARNGSRGPNSSDTTSNPMALALERDVLIDEIRNKDGFEGFMKPKSLEELAPAARDGPVVFLNLGEVRCDALVLLLDEDGVPYVISIPLNRVTLQGTEKLSKTLVDLLSKANVRSRDTRKHKVHGVSDDKNTIFKAILKTLWLDYVQPTLDGLAYQVNLESPPRLWWCTTGPLAFLPLHAAGIYDLNEAGHKVSDYVVSSYTPTLTALLDKASPIVPNEPKILTVAISNTPGASLPCTEEEVRTLQQLAANLRTVGLVNDEATQERVLKELEESVTAP